MNTAFLCRFAPVVLMTITLLGGCASEQGKTDDFFTSGSREADQRADQRVARDQQLEGTDADTEKQVTLYERLGGEQGLTAIVDDFVQRVLNDPRVNWQREGITRGGFSFSRGRSMEWDDSPENVNRLKKHLVQFMSLATGGPTRYDGKDMRAAHENMHITNAQFDASVGDLKQTLDKLQIADEEQKELLAIVESTRPQIVEAR